MEFFFKFYLIKCGSYGKFKMFIIINNSHTHPGTKRILRDIDML